MPRGLGAAEWPPWTIDDVGDVEVERAVGVDRLVWPGLRWLIASSSTTEQRRAEQLMPRAHRAISNLTAWMDGTHRGVSDQHLAVYLDE